MVAAESKNGDWHLNKSFRIGELVGIAVIFFAAFNWLNAHLTSQDKQLSLVIDQLRRTETALSSHTGSGPHAEAAISLAVLKTDVANLSNRVNTISREQAESLKLLQQIIDQLADRPFVGPRQ